MSDVKSIKASDKFLFPGIVVDIDSLAPPLKIYGYIKNYKTILYILLNLMSKYMLTI